MLSRGGVNRNSQEIADPPLAISVPKMTSTGITRVTVIRKNAAFARLWVR